MELGSADLDRRTFDIERKGYDRAQVILFLHHAAAAMENLEATARSGQLRVEQLEREMRDVHVSVANGFHQAVASRALRSQAAASAARAVGATERATTEAAQIDADAEKHAQRLRDEAEALLQAALATAAAIEAEQQRLDVAADAERQGLLADAQAEADLIVGEAKIAAGAARAEAQRFAQELRELTATETIELVSYAKAMAAAILGGAEPDEVTISVEDDNVAIELHDPAPMTEKGEPVTEGLGGVRPSRYEARSANLPRIGDKDATSTIDSMESLRSTATGHRSTATGHRSPAGTDD